MVDQNTLSLSIDASEAKRGAAEFCRAADDIKRKAAEMERAVDRSSQAFRNMLSAAENSSKAISLAAQSKAQTSQMTASRNLNSNAISSAEKNNGPSVITGTIQGSFKEPIITSQAVRSPTQTPDSFLIRFLRKKKGIGDLIDLIDALNDQVEAKKLLEQERAQEIENSIDEARDFLITANDPSEDPRRRIKAEEDALDHLENALSLLQESIEQSLERERRQRNVLDEFEGSTGQNPRNVSREELSLYERGVLDANIRLQAELADTLAQIQAIGDAIVSIRNERPADSNLRPELTPQEPNIPSNFSLPSNVDLDSVKQQIEDVNRCIDLLKEQQNTLRDNADQSMAQKEQELELLQREKECLERLNKALQENQTLRGLTGDQSDDILEGAAAYDDLSTAVDQNGEAAQQLRTDVDGLNATLSANAGINTEVVGGLNQELVARQQLNDAIVERRRLEEEQKQRLIDAEDEAERRGKAVEASIEQIKDAAANSFKDVIKGTESVGDAFQKLADRITDILLDLALDELLKGGTGFSDLFGTVFGGIGSIFGGGGGSDPLGLLTPAAFGGGIVPFHTGGIVGLRPDEIPIIAQRGEEVLTRNDPRHRDNGAAGGNVVVNVTFPNARNTQEARQAGSEIAAKAAAAAQRGMARKGIG